MRKPVRLKPCVQCTPISSVGFVRTNDSTTFKNKFLTSLGDSPCLAYSSRLKTHETYFVVVVVEENNTKKNGYPLQDILTYLIPFCLTSLSAS